jgi:cysteinyl-tRNA synthetase
MHIGNIRAYVNWDILHRSLLYLGFDVKRVMNLTDVGHMSADQDFGEDKVEQSAIVHGKNPIDISNEYIESVLQDFSDLNILAPNGDKVDPKISLDQLEEYGFLRATNYIDEMISLIKDIEKNGHTYETEKALYFDVTTIPDYTIFTKQALEDKNEGVREDVNVDPDKRNPADFVLWMKRVGKYKNHIMHWNSPWGEGFPGWHIECSAMGTSSLGNQFDIHTGGVDHIPVHHANERAQNIGAFSKPVVKYWIHNEWLVLADDRKMSKSDGSGTDLDSIRDLGFESMDIRYLFISVNYHMKLNFSKEALEGARNSRLALISRLKSLRQKSSNRGELISDYVLRFKECLEDSLNISKALALINDLLKSQFKPEDILCTVYDFDRVLALDLESFVEVDIDIPESVIELGNRRLEAKREKDYDLADSLRDKITNLGFKVIDTEDSFRIEKI